jgi:MFS family permease
MNGASENPRHVILKRRPVFWAITGIAQTLMSAGIIFGWASLLPVLKEEGVHASAETFSQIFTYGAVGNYISTLFFGFILDHQGPRRTGILASILLAVGLILCSYHLNSMCLSIGFTLLGFSGPGIQMPTLHLANLFPGKAREGGTGGGAIFMSAQAAAFDGGTAIFAVLRLLSQHTGVTSTTFFRWYLLVPIWVFFTAVFVWPDDSLETENDDDPYMGAASPYLSPGRPGREKRAAPTTSLVNASLSTVLIHPAFLSLATWVSIHILKLNFVVATLNDQLNEAFVPEEADSLIGIFGAMLPFGFVVLPVIARLLETPMWSLQAANSVGILYGAILAFLPTSPLLLTCLVFPAVATSRQLVYSTVFHQIGEVFGFANYGVLLGLTNVCVSTASLLQTPLVAWSESLGSYSSANKVLLGLTLPLFVSVLWSKAPSPANKGEMMPLKRVESVVEKRSRAYSSI